MEQKIIESITKKLLAIEQEYQVKVLYAVESGSRAWGFESQDSDYDIRFIYAHEKNWYLNILPKRDVIEEPITDDFDYSGWDLRKTLFLLHKSNPVLFEWLRSPQVYVKEPYSYSVLQALAQEYFSPLSSVYHYLHMARGNYQRYLQTDKVKIKKYFYVLRPLLGCIWIERYNESPPIEFKTLTAGPSDPALSKVLEELLQRKKSGTELNLEPPNAILKAFIEHQMSRFETLIHTFDPRKKPNQDFLEQGFLRILEHSFSPGNPRESPGEINNAPSPKVKE